MQQPSPSEETQNLLARLSQRPGVQSTLILSRDTGAIVRSSGLITPEEIGEDGTAPTNGTYVNGAEGEAKKKGTRNAEEVARTVYAFVKSAGSLIEELNGENDEAKLLRVRTKKNELVIVPGMARKSPLECLAANQDIDSKFLLVVIHETPPA
jgi:predicted regulator of Ras-like GTPase activity (Roadblock/LC7/MglB family)